MLGHGMNMTLPYDSKFNEEIEKIKLEIYANKSKMRNLKRKHRKYLRHANDYISFKNIHIDFLILDEIHKKLEFELFHEFNWDIIKTKDDVVWKEYFHSLFELVIFDHEVLSHTSKLLIAKDIPSRYNIIPTPTTFERSQKVREIQKLFDVLKCEHTSISRNCLADLEIRMCDSTRMSTKIECDALDIEKDIEDIERENKFYSSLIEWSKQ
jgi:hypothetical protein